MIHIPYFDYSGHDELYRNVAKFFGEASGAVAQRLANDSSNLFPIIKNAYAEIAKKASISRIAPDDINVKVKNSSKNEKIDKHFGYFWPVLRKFV